MRVWWRSLYLVEQIGWATYATVVALSLLATCAWALIGGWR